MQSEPPIANAPEYMKHKFQFQAITTFKEVKNKII